VAGKNLAEQNHDNRADPAQADRKAKPPPESPFLAVIELLVWTHRRKIGKVESGKAGNARVSMKLAPDSSFLLELRVIVPSWFTKLILLLLWWPSRPG
jgi:hypothetical protein